MRRTILAGLVLVAATFVTVLVGDAFDLEIEAVVLLGLAVGAIIALVPDLTPVRRLAAFALGFAAAVVGYLLRAGVLPDTSMGRAVAAGLVVLLCVGVVALSMGRLPLWAALLGAASLVGAYESAYSAAPSRVVDTIVTSGTALLFCVAVGFLVTSVFSAERRSRTATRTQEEDTTPFNDMMEPAK